MFVVNVSNGFGFFFPDMLQCHVSLRDASNKRKIKATTGYVLISRRDGAMERSRANAATPRGQLRALVCNTYIIFIRHVSSHEYFSA